MLKKIILALSLINPSLGQSQGIEFEIKSSEIYRDKISQRTFDIKPIGQLGNFSYYLFRPYNAVYATKDLGFTTKHFIGKFDSNMNLIQREPIELVHDKKDLSFVGETIIKDKLFVFSSYQEKKEKKYILLAQTINTETLSSNNDVKVIGELSSSELSYSDVEFHFTVSDDDSKVIVFYTLINKDNEAINSGIYLFDNSFELKWKRENLLLKRGPRIFAFNHFKAANDGSLYILGQLYPDRQNYYDEAKFKDRGFFSTDVYFTDKPNYKFIFYKISDNDSKDEHAELLLQDKFIRSLNFSISNNSTINCFGIYSTTGTISASGAFTFNFDVNLKKSTEVSLKEFNIDLISQGFGDNEIKRFRRSIENKEEWDPFDYVLSNVKTMKNGEKYFMAEQYIRGRKREGSGKSTVVSTIHLYKDVYSIYLNSANNIKSVRKISKTQYMLNTDRFSSYTSFEKNGKLYFLFNEILYEDGAFKGTNFTNTYLAALDDKGNQEKAVVKLIDRKYPVMMPESKIQLNDQSISVISMDEDRYQVERILIKNE